jgi:hypothetical protein
LELIEMNSSPVTTWSEFQSGSTEAIYTFAASDPWVVQGLCLLAAVVVGWFLVSAFRFDTRLAETRPVAGCDERGEAGEAE